MKNGSGIASIKRWEVGDKVEWCGTCFLLCNPSDETVPVGSFALGRRLLFADFFEVTIFGTVVIVAFVRPTGEFEMTAIGDEMFDGVKAFVGRKTHKALKMRSTRRRSLLADDSIRASGGEVLDDESILAISPVVECETPATALKRSHDEKLWDGIEVCWVILYQHTSESITRSRHFFEFESFEYEKDSCVSRNST